MRRHRLLPTFLTVVTATLLLPASPAAAGLFAPERGGSPNADRIASLYWIIFAIALVVFVIVEGALVYSLVKFRKSKGGIAEQIRGNTRLEIGWTLGAAVILVALAAVTFIKLDGIRTPENSGAAGLDVSKNAIVTSSGPGSELRVPPNGRSLNICVNGQQYVWRYTYDQADCSKNDFKAVYAYEELVVPTDTTVTLDITAQDVAHSWWVPQLGPKFDAVPGYVNHSWFKIPASKAGTTFTGNCAELCGRGHANMTAQVKAVTPAQYSAWLKQQKAAIAAADKGAAAGRKQFDSTTP